MLNKSVAVAVLAFAVGAPAMAAPSLPKLGSFGASGGNSKGMFSLPKAPGASAGTLPSLPSLSAPSSGQTPGYITTLKTLPATFLAVTPFTKTTEVLPRGSLGIKSTEISKPSFKLKSTGTHYNSFSIGKIGSEFTGAAASLTPTGLGVLKSITDSSRALPAVGVAELKGFGA